MSDPDSGPDLLNDLANDFAERYRRGERPGLTEYTARYPELAAEIRDLFPAMAVIEELGSVAAGPPGAHAQTATSDGVAPRQLGEYRILREVARGGMGIVYEAVQESLGRHVALKVLPFQSLADARQLERFRREARAAAVLHHSNIVPVFGVGEHDGVHYFAMQFIRGQALDSVLRELKGRRRGDASDPGDLAEGPALVGGGNDDLELTGTLAGGLLTGRFSGGSGVRGARDAHEGVRPQLVAPAGASARGPGGSSTEVFGARSAGDSRSDLPYFRSVARVGLQVAEALAYAHHQGVLHRDVKPANLLLDTEGTAWVTDFGLAKADGSGDLTGPGDLVGTLRYMAPERFRGESDPRGDVFSLGLTLYEMATLRPAFAAPERAQLIERMLHDEPPRPRAIDRRIPRDLETLILKAIAKEPGRRYQTAGDLAEDLGRFLADRPIRARRSRWPERLGRWCRRNPAIAGLTGVAAMLLVAAVVILTVSNVRITREQGEKDKAIDEARKALASARRSEREAKAQAELARDNARSTEEQRAVAIAQARIARRRFCAAQMNLAHQAWDASQPARVLELLEGLRPGFGQEDLRGFEWYYLWRLCHAGCRVTLHGGAGSFRNLAFSPDGRTLASGGTRVPVQLWDPATGRERPPPGGGQPEWNWSLAFSPDGKTLASASQDHPPTTWDVSGGRKTELLKPRGRVVAYFPDGKSLITSSPQAGSDGEDLEISDVATGKERAVLRAGPHEISYTVAIAADGRTVATGTSVDGVRLWRSDGVGWREGPYLGGHGWGPCVAISPDGKTLAVGGPVLKLYELATGRERAVLHGHVGVVFSVAFSPDGKALASGGNDRTVRVWDLDRCAERSRRAHLGPVLSVRFAPDGKTLASAGSDSTIKLWGTEPEPEKDVLADRKAIGAVGFAADGRMLLTLGAGPARLWEVATGRARTTFPASAAKGYAVSPDGRTFASDDAGGSVMVWDVATGRRRTVPATTTEKLLVVAFSPDGKALASGYHDGAVTVDDLTSGRRWSLKREGGVSALAFSPDGSLLAMAGRGQFVALVDAITGRLRLNLGTEDTVGTTPWVRAVAFSPDGKLLAVGDDQGTVRLRDVATGSRRGVLKGHTDVIRCLAFSPDGESLASGGEDRTVKLWDLTAGQERLTLRGHSATVTAVAFSADGGTLATGSEDGTARLWRAAGDPEARARKTEADPDDPETARSLNDEGDGQWRARRPAEAEAAYRKALNRATRLTAAFPDAAEHRAELSRSWFNLGLILANRGATEEAERARRRAVTLFRSLPSESRRALGEQWNDLAWALVTCPDPSLRDPPRAVRLAEWTVELGPMVGHLWNTLGVARYRAGEWRASVEALTRSMALQNGGDGNDWFFLAMAHWQLGGREEARGWHDRAARWMEKEAPPGGELAGFRAESGALVGRVVPAPRPAPETEPDDGEKLGDALLARGRYDEAASLYREALGSRRRRLGPEHRRTDDAMSRLAFALQAQERIGEAVPEFARAVKERPDDPALRHRLALALAASGDRDGYRRAGDAALARFAGSGHPLAFEVSRGCAIAPGGVADFAAALGLAEAAVARDPEFPWCLYALGLVHYRAGHYEEAIRRLTESARSGRGWNATALNWPVLAMAHWKLGHITEARRWLRECRPAAGDPSRGVPPGEAIASTALWWDRAEFQILRREAEELILDSAFPADPFEH